MNKRILVWGAGLFLMFGWAGSLWGQPSLAVAPVQATPGLLRAQQADGKKLEVERVIESLDNQLLNALAGTGRFRIVSRTDLKAVLAEQALADSGNINPETAAEAFKIEGAEYLLVTVLDDFQDFRERARMPGVDRVAERRRIRIAGVARIYNASTGVMLGSTSLEVEKSDLYETLQFTQSDGDRTERVLRQVAAEMADSIAHRLSETVFPARVLAKTAGQITLNRGETSQVKKGDVWLLFAMGSEPLIDPDTGENLGVEEVLLGSAEIINVNPRTSQARLIEDNGVQPMHYARPSR